MAHRATLVAVSSIQLAAQFIGHAVALRRRRHFDVPFLAGSPEHIVRDWLWFGTAYSAPPYLLGLQVWAIARLLRGPDDRACWVLHRLGTGLTLGYPNERWNRVRMRPRGFDPLETPIVAAGWSGAMAMAVLARRGRGAAQAGSGTPPGSPPGSSGVDSIGGGGSGSAASGSSSAASSGTGWSGSISGPGSGSGVTMR
ncbi:hypothetical protein [Modestobacter marinus]|uniref:hypothetical protein n=1 Tax=Modestobacter marinus TaxID=477641 RepID=UPI001C96BF12|nr:hypothetical protein [Modestobacter marinus]